MASRSNPTRILGLLLGCLGCGFDSPQSHAVGLSVTVTVQGLVEDACSAGAVPYSVTNGLVLEVGP